MPLLYLHPWRHSPEAGAVISDHGEDATMSNRQPPRSARGGGLPALCYLLWIRPVAMDGVQGFPASTCHGILAGDGMVEGSSEPWRARCLGPSWPC